MRFLQTGSDESFTDIHRVPRTATKLIRLSSCVIAAVAPRYLPASFAWRAVASREGCFALARRSCFCRRLARFLALSLPLLCPIASTFARFSIESKASDWISRHGVKPGKTRVEGGGRDQNQPDSLLAPSCLGSGANHLRARRLLLPRGHTGDSD